jgi:hypothetical protein
MKSKQKNRIAKSLLLAGLTFSLAQVNAQQSMSEDEQLGCEILMCMANPNGVTAEPKCKEPINKLMRRMAKFWKRPALPRCLSVEGEGTKYTMDKPSYANCPNGYDTVEDKTFVYVTTIEDAKKLVKANQAGQLLSDPPTIEGKLYMGIGDGSNYENAEIMPSKVCVENYLGQYSDKQNEEKKPVKIYENIKLIAAPSSSVRFKVFIKNQLFTEGELK